MNLGEQVISLYYAIGDIFSDIALNAQPNINEEVVESIFQTERFANKTRILLSYGSTATSIDEVFQLTNMCLTLLIDEKLSLERFLTQEHTKRIKQYSAEIQEIEKKTQKKNGRISIPLPEGQEENLLQMLEDEPDAKEDTGRILEAIANLDIPSVVSIEYSYPPLLNHWNQIKIEISPNEAFEGKLVISGKDMSFSHDEFQTSLKKGEKKDIEIEIFTEKASANQFKLNLGELNRVIILGSPVSSENFWFDLQKKCSFRII